MNELEFFLENNIAPVIYNKELDLNTEVIVIEADCSELELLGNYANNECPSWYKDLVNQNKNISLLIINNITKIDKNRQRRFIELLKHRKIGSFCIPENTRIIIYDQNINRENVSDDILALCISL